MESDCCLRDLPASFDIFNSRSPHGERRRYIQQSSHVEDFSIHAPRMESDRGANRRCICIHLFNSRSPHGERQIDHNSFIPRLVFNSRSPYGERRNHHSRCSFINHFQFTLPVWGATVVGFSYDFILLLLFISANQEKAYFLPCFFGFSSLCCLWFASAALILFFRW